MSNNSQTHPETSIDKEICYGCLDHILQENVISRDIYFQSNFSALVHDQSQESNKFKQFTVKCPTTNCKGYFCMDCLSTQYKVNGKYDLLTCGCCKSSLIMDRNDYYKYGLDISRKYQSQGYHCSSFWILQDIYQDQTNPDKRQLGQQGVLDSFDDVRLYSEGQSLMISGLLKCSQLGDPFRIIFPVEVFVYKGMDIIDSNVIKGKLIEKFKKDVKSGFDNLVEVHVNSIIEYELKRFTQLKGCALSDMNKSPFQLGFIDYIKKILTTIVDHNKSFTYEHDGSYKRFSAMDEENRILFVRKLNYQILSQSFYYICIHEITLDLNMEDQPLMTHPDEVKEEPEYDDEEEEYNPEDYVEPVIPDEPDRLTFEDVIAYFKDVLDPHPDVQPNSNAKE